MLNYYLLKNYFKLIMDKKKEKSFLLDSPKHIFVMNSKKFQSEEVNLQSEKSQNIFAAGTQGCKETTEEFIITKDTKENKLFFKSSPKEENNQINISDSKNKRLFNFYKSNFPDTLLNDMNISAEDNMKFMKRKFVNNERLQCNILILSKNEFVVYTNHTEKFLLRALKIQNKLRKNYLIYADCNCSEELLLGKLNANFLKDQIILYDLGKRPDKGNNDISNLRQYLLEVDFIKNSFSNIFCQANIYIAKEGKSFINSDYEKKDKLSVLFNKSPNEMIQCTTKFPIFSLSKNSYGLNFSYRVKENSSKNFQIIFKEEKEKEIIVLECGKINTNIYSMDFSFPLSPLEAFAICLSFLMQ